MPNFFKLAKRVTELIALKVEFLINCDHKTLCYYRLYNANVLGMNKFLHVDIEILVIKIQLVVVIFYPYK